MREITQDRINASRSTRQEQSDRSTIEVPPTDLDILQHFGSPESLAQEAVHAFAIQKVKERITTCRKEIEQIQGKYALTFDEFRDRVTSDEKFVEALNLVHPLWETDFNRWEFYQMELEEWDAKLKAILKT
ncbi:MAG: hypothetical protein O7E52_22810 [Candidatus Poribacteria bacterium]|nr:hypothetical protein [Candidatus Poribacteria bacterium]